MMGLKLPKLSDIEVRNLLRTHIPEFMAVWREWSTSVEVLMCHFCHQSRPYRPQAQEEISHTQDCEGRKLLEWAA